MNEEMIKNMIKTQQVLTGKVIKYLEHDDSDNDEIIVQFEDLRVNIKRTELDLVPFKKPLNTWVDHVRKFVLIGYDLETGTIYGSIKAYKEIKRNEVLKELRDEHQVVEAKVTRIFPWGAYLTYNKTTLVLFNNKWAEDYAIISEYLQNGDRVKVKFFDIDEKGYIQVESVEKYCEGITEDISELKPRDVLVGRVRTVQLDKIFVNIGKGLDVLCPIPPEAWYNPEPSVGDAVAVRLTQASNPLRMRGKIQGKLETEEMRIKAQNLSKPTYITKEEFVKACSTDPDFVYGDVAKKSLSIIQEIREKGE